MKLTKCTTIAHGKALGSQWPHIRSSVSLVIVKKIYKVRCALTRSFFVDRRPLHYNALTTETRKL